MANNVGGIRGDFFNDLIENYAEYNRGSLVYRFTWEESAVELLKKLKQWKGSNGERCFSEISDRRPVGRKTLRKRLEESMRGCTKGQIMAFLEQESQKSRRDLWQQLWLRNTYYRMLRKSQNSESSEDFGNKYLLWLVQYLAERDKYYLESCQAMTDGDALPELLYRMAKEGLRDTENAPNYELRTETDRLRREKLKDSLRKLAKRLVDEKDSGETVSRLCRLGFLDQLWGPLEQTAMHMKIKNWFQDSGFPLREPEKSDPVNPKPTKPRKYPPPKGDRKQDFTMRLFAAYCDNEDGYDFARKDQQSGGWRLDINGFCVLEAGELKALIHALEKDGKLECCYIPLAVHLYSGCVFFLAGSAVYEDLYPRSQNSVLRMQFEKAKKRGSYCFDYLRAGEEYWDKYFGDEWQAVGKDLQILPVFHNNEGREYSEMLMEFIEYCKDGEKNLIQGVRSVNGDYPDGTPKVFRWAFRGTEQDDYKPSPEAVAAISKDCKIWEQTQSGRLQ